MDNSGARPRPPFGLGLIIFVILAVLFAGRSVAGFVIELEWWKEIGQPETLWRMIAYGYAPVGVAALLLFAVLWISHARGMKSAGTGLRQHSLYAKLSTVVIFAVSFVLATLTVDAWTIVRYLGGSTLDGSKTFIDPVFGKSLLFYFFDLPAYHLLLRFLLVASLGAAVVYWLTARGWSIRSSMGTWNREEPFVLDPSELRLSAALESRFFRIAAAIALAAFAVRLALGRYTLLLEDHSSLVGVDWVAENVTLPLIWLSVAACAVSVAALLAGRFKIMVILPVALLAQSFVPAGIHALYVRPSEITIQKTYIQRHIAATRDAYGLTQRSREIDYGAKLEAAIDPKKHTVLFDNVRLWDWRAFHDTVTQIQALRPYYVFKDSDVDRYMIDGQLRQLLLTPRELDVTQLPADARAKWVNPHFIYTHGYGLVVAEAARITADGLPHLLIQDAPPHVKTSSLKLTQPELYYGEVTHEPVFVRTAQPEFNYPSGAGNVESRYDGKGGFPIASPLMRFAAALSTGDWNIILTSYLKPESRMMIRRSVHDRVNSLASFIDWDPDPYLVIADNGRLIWMIDGYTASNSHPYSKSYSVAGIGALNYVRNSVKATVDAYDGSIRLYAFDDQDPLLASYRNLFPGLILPRSEMPADLQSHARYPELLFRIQAEAYRTFHMTDSEAFFNKEDVWDLSRNLNNSAGRPEPVTPTYLIATLPGEEKPEFLLVTTFTPRNKDNLIGLMAARCDGDALGELVFLQLSKQELIFGPMQVEARITQDQNISKDLTLWNQQGSQVLRGQMLVLPIEQSFIYIEPIYIQAAEARMPQLKKVVIAMGDRLIYSDTYEQALAELAGISLSRPESAPAGQPSAETAQPQSDPYTQVREIWNRYRRSMSEGRYQDAGKELERLEQILGGSTRR
jgi:uncharacterized protein